MAVANNMFRSIVGRIRKFCTSVFMPNRPSKRVKPIREIAQKVEVNNELLTVDIPQNPLGDELSWDNIESGLEVIQPKVDERTTPKISICQPYTTLDLSPKHLENEISRELVSQGGLEYTPPFFVCATVRKQAIEGSLSFPRFRELPFELRLKIWHHTIQPRLVHYNITGAKRSCLKIGRRLPVILQICHESRCEGLQIFDISNNATRPIFFNPKSDTLLWTRYPNCPKTFNEDAERLKKSSTLKNVRHLAILHRYWNMLLSHEGPKEVYTAIRKAPKLEVLTLVDDYFLRRTGYSQVTYERVMKLIDICLEEHEVRPLRWEKELRNEGKKFLWRKWDVNLVDREGLPKWKLPEIRFARVVLEMQ